MNLIFGCSHVLGDELDQELSVNSTVKEKIKYIEDNRFANILFKLSKQTVKVHGKSGADNSWIAHKVIEEVDKSTETIKNVIVCWSGPTRMQKIIDGGTFFLNPLYPGHFSINLKDKFPSIIKDLNRWEEIESKVFLDLTFCNNMSYHYANYIKLYLENKKINFIFIKSVESDIDLKPLTVQSSNLSFHEFYKDKFKTGKNGHCLADGHREWAHYLFSTVGKYIKKNDTII